MTDTVTDEYAATYYVYLSQHALGCGMRECAERLMASLGDDLTTEQSRAFLDVPVTVPELPANQILLSVAERGRSWLKQRAPGFVQEADIHFAELMDQVRRQLARMERKR